MAEGATTRIERSPLMYLCDAWLVVMVTVFFECSHDVAMENVLRAPVPLVLLSTSKTETQGCRYSERGRNL